jgi:glucose-6-phosphate dehydrogenase assembly protein OpcA
MQSNTASPTALSELGTEVPLGQVSRELNSFFASDKPVTRASLMNFAVYSEDMGALEENTGIIRDVTREHACRALLLQMDPQGVPPVVRSWVTAHCNLGQSGGKSVCSEQISFLLQGESPGLLSNTLFAHLDSDLPLVFWWQGGFTERWEPTLYSRIDRLVLDSGSWDNPAAEFKKLKAAWQDTNSRFNVMDLTWTRILQLRLALAACFDDATSLAALPGLQNMTLHHCPAHSLSAKMLVVWMAKRLGWVLESVSSDRTSCVFISREGLQITATFVATPGSEKAIDCVELAAPNAAWKIHHCPEADFWVSTATVHGVTHEYMTPDTLDTPAELAIERLRRGCNNRLYFQILEDVGQLI